LEELNETAKSVNLDLRCSGLGMKEAPPHMIQRQCHWMLPSESSFDVKHVVRKVITAMATSSNDEVEGRHLRVLATVKLAGLPPALSPLLWQLKIFRKYWKLNIRQIFHYVSTEDPPFSEH
jgi:hypothetical protein